jgi:uncharacterized membrane protein YfcA
MIPPAFAAATALGVAVGSTAGLRLGTRWKVRRLKLLLAVVLFIVSGVMLLTE